MPAAHKEDPKEGAGVGEVEKARKPASARHEEKNLRCIWPEDPGGSGGKAQEKGANTPSQPLGSPHLLALFVKILPNGSWRETEPRCHTVIWRETLPGMTIWVRFEFSTINKNQIGLMPMYSKHIQLEMEPAVSQFSALPSSPYIPATESDECISILTILWCLVQIYVPLNSKWSSRTVFLRKIKQEK